MKQQKRRTFKITAIAFYIAATIILAIGIYMYQYNIQADKGFIPNGPRGSSLPNSLSWEVVIIFGSLMAICGLIMHIVSCKKN